MNTPILSASILSADFMRLGDEVTKMIAAGTDWIHFDVMDNHYVPNLTVGPMVCEAFKKSGFKNPIDVHLMVKPVERTIHDFIKAGADIITFHPEATEHIDQNLQLIRDHNIKAGLALNPATSPETIEYILDKLDIVLVMSVNPGFGGQTFIPSALKKIKKLRKMVQQHNPNIRIAVDGGVNAQTIGEISRAGADTFIAGSALFHKPDYAEAVAQLRSLW